MIVNALKRGLTLKDFDDMTIGMIFDYVNEYDNIFNKTQEESQTREATQEDINNFDSFFM